MWKIINNLTASKYYYAAIMLLILIFTGMRLAYINADAPQDLSISAASYTDEGFKTYEPRNKALFGDWKWTPEDEYEGWEKKSPLTAYQYLWIFSHFGVSFASIRILSVFYATLTMAFLFLFLARNFDRRTALIGLVLYGVNFFTAMYNRLGLYETHLLCFIMISFFGFSEFFRPSAADKGRQGPNRSNIKYSAAELRSIISHNVLRSHPRSRAPGFDGFPLESARAAIKKIALRSFFFMLGIAGFLAGFYIKRNILMLVPAIAPAALLYLCRKFGRSEKFMNRILIAFIGAFLVVYLLFAHMGYLKVKLAFLLLSIHIFGQPLMSYIPFTAFDPIQMVLAKGMYMEFIFLHPFTFFAGLLFSLYSFYRYIVNKESSAMDLFISSWLMFGFFFTTLLYYSPSRYYLILVIPLVVAAGRLIADLDNKDTAEYLTEKKTFPHNIMFSMFLLFSVLYTGVVFVVQTVPVFVRNRLIDLLYPAYLKGDMSPVVAIMAVAILLELACIFSTLLNRKRIFALLKHRKFHAILLSIILALQLFQYGKWFFFHDRNLYNASRELGRELPENAVIAGSWSAGLVIENRLRALILQSLIPYNHNLVSKINCGIGIPVNGMRGSEKTVEHREDIPVYIAVCRNVIFEKTITEIYKEQFVPESMVKQLRFGFFRVEIFKMKKCRKKTSDAVNSLFKSFL